VIHASRSLPIVFGLVVAACGAGPMGSAAGKPIDKAGGEPAPTVLRLGTAESESNPIIPVLRRFADAVANRTAGRVTVDIVFRANDGATDYEAAVIDHVRDGSLDIGVVGTRGWDAMVPALGSLQAPFLIDSYPLLNRVLSSSVANDLVASVDAAGFIGLGLFPGQLRHPLGFRAPIVSATDYAGLRIRVPTSVVADGLMRGLGAVPVHLVGDALVDAIDGGDIKAAESSVGNAASFPATSWLTANVTFYPLVGMLFVDRSRFGSLEAATQDALRAAAADAGAWAIAQDLESADIAAFCATGGRFATTSETTLDELVRRADPVYQSLKADPATAALIDRIRILKTDLAANPAIPSCQG
jgi:TRAP-type C4-dicarboxylate transport system substrate-binding protein